MNDDFLTRYRKPPRAEFASALYQRISKPMTVPSRYPAIRYAAFSVSILVLLAFTVLAFPAARSFAQSLIERVGGYGFTLGEPQALDASRVPGPIRIIRTSESVSIELTSDNVSIANNPVEAGDLAGFTLLVPSYLPSGYTALGNWYVIHEGNGTVVTADSHDTGKNTLFLNQWKVGEGDLKIQTRQEIVQVSVRGRSGVWLPDTNSPNGNNALVWEQNGITYSLIGNSLSLDEMLKVAESLRQ